ncbi:uncharacterized protein LOC122849725 [Aphidius gifuensis]|uniref:uncharacterized protein LOC122849725 n=1 Tax=Aphidius gifuensis TaxID=684658 RepID=UPI001CDCD67B|nr:uncharacterized protein LOC122849725 [Aphidius gifuensis]
MALRMGLIMAILCSTLVEGTSNGGESGPNSPVFNLDHTALEKNIAAIFNKVAHSSATTKRSVPAYEAQVSASTTLSTIPSPLTTSTTTTTPSSTPPSSSSSSYSLFSSLTSLPASPSSPQSLPPSRNIPIPRVTVSPTYRELPSYAPPSRAPFTPPLPPEYLNPFADKPTLRGTNYETSHTGVRRPIPPPSLTPAHERIPIRPPDLIHDPIQDTDKFPPGYSSNLDGSIGYNNNNKNNIPIINNNNNNNKDDRDNDSSDYNNDRKISSNNNDFVPTLHYPSISRILSGSNGRKQDIPEILLKPLSTKMPVSNGGSNIPALSTTEKLTTMSNEMKTTVSSIGHSTYPTIFNLPNTRRKQNGRDDDDDNDDDNNNDRRRSNSRESGHIKTEEIEIVDAERLPYPQAQPPSPSKRPNELSTRKIISNPEKHPLESTWRIAWCLHVYIAATMFTIMALYSIYKIVRFNESNNLLTQSYFLTVHLLLTTVCTLRCFHLFYDAYNLGHSLSEPVSQVLLYLPAPLLSTAFATLFLYLAKCSGAPALNTKLLSPMSITLCSIIHITMCMSLHISDYIIRNPNDEKPTKLLPLICQCIYIVICVSLGLFYMYVYRVVRTQINLITKKTIGPNVGNDPTTIALNSAITTTIATALLFIVMGFLQLYGIFGIQEKFKQPYPWLWWGWQFSVRLLELSICGLLAWVASLSQYPLREKQMQQHSAHSGFALFPCGSSTSTENMDDVLYPAICSTNQAIQNYTLRTGKQVYDDSFPLNTLPDHLNITGTFERHSIRKSGTMAHFPSSHSANNGGGGGNPAINNINNIVIGEGRGSLNRHGNGIQTMRGSDTRHSTRHMPETMPIASGTTGSTMLVAEDGFVRFRSIGAEDDDFSDSQSIVGTHGRGGTTGSLSGSVRYSTRHQNSSSSQQQHHHHQQQQHHQHQQHQHPHQYQHPHTLQHSHLTQSHHQGHHQSHHQLYNNT